jgi:hypothetical protein
VQKRRKAGERTLQKTPPPPVNSGSGAVENPVENVDNYAYFHREPAVEGGQEGTLLWIRKYHRP